MARLGDVEFSAVTEESPQRDSSITDKPIEEGGVVADHVEPNPYVLNITGEVTGDGAGSKFAQLQEYWRKGKRLRYAGRNVASNMVIESFNSDHTVQVANGFRFSMTLKRLEIVRPAVVEIVAPDPIRDPEAAPDPEEEPSPAPDPEEEPSPAGAQATSSQTKEEEDGGKKSKQDKEADEEQRGSMLSEIAGRGSEMLGRSDPDSKLPPHVR